MNRRERSALLSQLRRDARCIAGHFQLHYRSIAAEHPRVKSRYGACYEDGLIKIRLNHATTGRALKYSSLIDTLCHELAHLRHFNHGPEFKDFFLRLLRWARGEGIYQPGPACGPRGQRRLVRASSARDHRPSSQELLHRNGIPVFPPLDPTGRQRTLPWERLLDPATPDGDSQQTRARPGDTQKTRRRAPRAPAAPRSPEEQAKFAPEQLSLF